ncbi:hypothetical protein MKW98_004236 [Papaver atlanticum]|uniref:Uncharacterized protein n=1 Tax=Papaver atlanticum TaxID=357466 RepID=A0AAD4T8Q5_9MAGN|nr:hypothetical protein MKW98_004236 [Papaver atlanticum]
MLLFKGMEQLNNIVEHAKQRHHIIGQYVVGIEGLVQDIGTKDQVIVSREKFEEQQRDSPPNCHIETLEKN